MAINLTHTVVFNATTLADYQAILAYLTQINATLLTLTGYSRTDSAGQRRVTVTYTEPWVIPSQQG